jgi:hypothetical protein
MRSAAHSPVPGPTGTGHAQRSPTPTPSPTLHSWPALPLLQLRKLQCLHRPLPACATADHAQHTRTITAHIALHTKHFSPPCLAAAGNQCPPCSTRAARWPLPPHCALVQPNAPASLSAVRCCTQRHRPVPGPSGAGHAQRPPTLISYTTAQHSPCTARCTCTRTACWLLIQAPALHAVLGSIVCSLLTPPPPACCTWLHAAHCLAAPVLATIAPAQ